MGQDWSLDPTVIDIGNTKNKISLSSAGVLTIDVSAKDEAGTRIDGEGVALATVKVQGKKVGISSLAFTGSTNKVSTKSDTGTTLVNAKLTLEKSTLKVIMADIRAGWRMDDEAGKTVADSKGVYPAYASYDSIVDSKSGFGKARNFAAGDSIDFKTSPMGLGNAFSVSIWVKPSNCFGTTKVREVAYVSQLNGFMLGTKMTGTGVCVPYGKLFLGSDSVEVVGDSSNKLTKGVWTQLALVWDGSKLRLVRNGINVKEASGTAGIGYDRSNNITLGFSKFAGLMDNFQVYNKALTVSEMTSMYNGQPGVLANGGNVGWWKMEETQGNSLADSSGKTNNGTASMGGITEGLAGKARSLNGVNASIGTTKVLAVNSDFTIETWVKPTVDKMGIKAGIIQTSESAGFSLTANSDGTGYRAVVKGKAIEGGSLVADKWQYVVLTYSKGSGKMSLFVDGNEVSNATATHPGTTGYKVVMGKNGTVFWNGLIDEVTVYNTARSAEEISAVYKGFEDDGKTDAPSCHVAICPDNSEKHASGDANCDGKISAADVGLWWEEYYGSSLGETEMPKGRANFNCDAGNKKVDMGDYAIWLQNNDY